MVHSPRAPVLASLLEKEAVPLATLRTRYGALLALVDTLLGVVPNCDSYLEIWPPAFRSYNVMVPNRTAQRTVPPSRCGAAPRSSRSRARSTARRCRRRIARPCAWRGRSRWSLQRSTTTTALLRQHFSPAHEEWIVLGVAMMGWLNKAMDGLGIPLEAPTVAEVNHLIAASRWTPGHHMNGKLPLATPPPGADSLGKRLGILRHAPRAVSFDKQWTRGVPHRWPAVGDFLRDKTGHDFPLLGRLRHRGPIRAIATMIRDNFCESVVGRAEKLSAGLIYAATVHDDGLAAQLRAAGAAEVDDSPVQRLARALSPSPAAVGAEVIVSCLDLAPAAIVEVATFISLLQMLHRLESYYAA